MFTLFLQKRLTNELFMQTNPTYLKVDLIPIQYVSKRIFADLNANKLVVAVYLGLKYE